jgi:hypothetical protein
MGAFGRYQPRYRLYGYTEALGVLVKQNRTLFVETFQSELATHHR